MIKFSDGINVDTNGPLRPLKLPDGWYVVGEGMLVPMGSQEEAVEDIKLMKELNHDSDR